LLRSFGAWCCCLESLSRSDLGGATCGFAAHAKSDPLTGETIAIAYEAGRPTVQYLVVGVDGVARQRAEIAIPHMPLIHNVAITQSSVVVLDMPVTFDIAKVQAGQLRSRKRSSSESFRTNFSRR